ncbi:WD40 repeat-like protein [Leucogyrophana mollusca]|uniref:WD40 repeat-like protein n=1 Tax=Leucogyrophana mollusca TaxID=85980 RepID=A0ACB8B1M2_9AGAM|nr:WD40 repeat-like protein [Leucogyrophana mollusca]
MPVKSYQLYRTFARHTGPINCLRFSEDGAFLASGGDDGFILIWSLRDASLAQSIHPQQGPVVSLRWLNGPKKVDGSYLICGGADGTVQLWFRPNDKDLFRFVYMYTVFDGPIEDVVVNDAQGVIAVVGLGRLVLFSVRLDQQSPLAVISAEPAMSDPPRRALARSAHFFNDGQRIMVCYLDSKDILAWQISPWKFLWRHKLMSRIGSSSWCEDSKTLLVWNLVDGMDVYQFTDCPTDRFTLVRKLRVKIRINHTNQVDMDSYGKLAINGSDNGEVFLWDMESGEQVQVLAHG